MPRSSRHKSSKHGSREARDYSDSEKDSSLKERKTREGSVSHRGSKESASGEKRKYDSKSVEDKEFVRSGNDDFVEEYGGCSSKKRREKVDDDRWTGEVNDRELMKTDKDSKGLGDSKSRSSRRDESSGLAVNTDEGKRSGSKVESKHHRSERKERGEKGLDRDRKAKDYSKSERFSDAEAGAEVIGGEGSRKQFAEVRNGKDAAGNTGISIQDDLWNPETEREIERKVRRKKDSVGDMDKYQDGSREINYRRISSKDDTFKFVKYKDSGRKDDKYKDKYHDDVEKHYHPQEEKQPRDGCHSRDYINTRSDDKYSSSRIEKKDLDMQAKKLKPQDGERENDCGRYHRRHDDRDRDARDHGGDQDHDRDRGGDVDRDQGRDLDRDRERGRDLDRDRDRDRVRYRRERERERDRARDRDFTYDHSQEWDHDHDRDYGSHFDKRSSRYKEDRCRRNSPDDYYYHEKSKKVKADADADADRERSVTCRTHATDAVAGSSRGRSSPCSKSHVYVDKYRGNMHDDMKYGDSREVVGCPETPEKSLRYHSADKHSKLDDYCSWDPSAERSPGTRASPLVRIEKSPSTSIDRKYVKRPVRRQSLDVGEADRRSSGSNDVRDGSVNDDKQSRDMTSKKSLGEDYSPVESSFHLRGSQGNGSSLSHGPPNYRAGADSTSFMGSMGEDSRGLPSSRYRRSIDQNVGRAHGNPWKGVPNWASPLSNGFMPFPPVPQGPPPHGAFPGMLPQFPSLPFFGVRPPVEINHSAIPYHLPDPDRFPSPMRPLGWSMIDGLGPSHFHGWDGNNSLFRDEPPFYGPGNMSNGRSRESVVEPWKQNADMMSIDTTPMYRKDGHVMKPSIDEAHAAQGAQESLNESSQHEDMRKVDKRKTPSRTPKKETLLDMDKIAIEKTIELSDVDNAGNSLHIYLSKLDISIELTDPELYNECVNLAALKQREDVVQVKTEAINLVEGEAFDSIMDTNTDMKLLPVAEDSIFQRAMDLYKTHSSVRRSSLISEANGKNMPIPSLPSPEAKQTEQVAPKEEMVEEPVRESYETQASSASVNVLPASGGQNEQVVPTPAEETNTITDIYPSEKSKLLPEDVNHENPSAEVALHSDVVANLDIYNETEMTNVEEIKGKSEEEEELAPPCAEENELVGSSKKVSDPLILSHGSSVNKVCEALLPPNESESVILTRIHQNASGSTH